MTVYIEYVILDNFTFTSLICYLSYKIMREKARKARTAVATTVGTVCAVMYPFIKNAAVILIFKAALFAIMCVILYIKIPKFFLHSAVFLLSTGIIGGIQFMIAFLVHGNAFDALRLPVSDLPLSVFFLTSLSIFLCAKKLMKGINAHRTERNFIYDMKLTVGDKSKILRGLVDTGNTVRAERDVIFISSSAALDMMGMEFAKFLTEKNASSIIVHTAIGDKKIILLPGQIELYLAEDEHIFIDVQVGIGNIKNNNEYEAILPLSVLDKEKAL